MWNLNSHNPSHCSLGPTHTDLFPVQWMCHALSHPRLVSVYFLCLENFPEGLLRVILKSSRKWHLLIEASLSTCVKLQMASPSPSFWSPFSLVYFSTSHQLIWCDIYYHFLIVSPCITALAFEFMTALMFSLHHSWCISGEFKTIPDT